MLSATRVMVLAGLMVSSLALGTAAFVLTEWVFMGGLAPHHGRRGAEGDRSGQGGRARDSGPPPFAQAGGNACGDAVIGTVDA
jgi:hypothetical protein